MDKMKPSCDPAIHARTPSIPERIRALPLPDLIACVAGFYENFGFRHENKSDLRSLAAEFQVREQMAGGSVESLISESRPARRTVDGRLDGLSVGRKAAARTGFGDAVVLCWRRGRDPQLILELPLRFPAPEQAERAILALEAAGLGSFEAMVLRIHIKQDWEGVQRIMLDAIKT